MTHNTRPMTSDLFATTASDKAATHIDTLETHHEALTMKHTKLSSTKNVPALVFLFAAALLATLATGCELDAEDADAVDGLDATGSDAIDDTTAEPELLPYRYVRISDQSTKTSTVNGGADIDAILLTRRDGSQHAARYVEAFQHGGGAFEGPDLDPMEALGFPDSFYNWPDSSRCDVDRGYVSLGGSGGYLIVDMAVDITPGDRISVLEVGGCQWSGGKAIAEPVRVDIAVASGFDAQWVYLGSGTGPVIQMTVPQLPEVRR